MPIVVARFGEVDEWVHFDEPLIGEVGLNGDACAVAVCDFVGVGFDFGEEAGLVHVFYDSLTGFFETVKAFVLTGVFVECPIRIEDVDHGEVIALSTSIVVGIVCRCDLDGPGAFFGICQESIAYDGDGAFHERKHGLLAD
jgi:hypothetical protein